MKKTAQSQPPRKKATPDRSVPSSSLRKSMYLVTGLVAFIIYVNTLNHEFAFDDYPTIYGNQLTMKGVEAIPQLLHTAYWYGLEFRNDWLYRPLSMVMFATEWELSPKNPHLGHWINVLLYVLSSVILLRFLLRIFKDRNLIIPLSVCLLWIVHPLHTEVVANIKSRDEILSFLFSILTLDYFMRFSISNKNKEIIKGCVFYFLALMSKENSITITVIIPLMLYFFSSLSIRKNLLVSLFPLIPAVAYVVIRGMVLTSQLNLEGIPLIDNSLTAAKGDFMLEKGTAFYILGLYLKLLIFPSTLSSDYSYNSIPIVSLTNPVALLSLVIHLSAGIYALVRLPKKDPVSFGILFYLTTLSVVSNVLFLTRSTMAERFLYMPSLGFFIAVVLGLSRLFKLEQGKTDLRNISSVFRSGKQYSWLLIGLLLACSIRSIARNPDWKNDTTIFGGDVINMPGSSRLHFLYGNHMMQEVKQGKVSGDEANRYLNIADDELKRCVEIFPGYSQAFINQADLFSMRNNTEKTIEVYTNMIDQKLDLALAYSNLGNVYFRIQKYDSAMVTLRKAIETDSTYYTAYNNLGSVYFNLGDYDKAILNFRKAVDLNPQYQQAWKNLGSSYGSKGELDKAIESFEKALNLYPDDADAKKFLDMTISRKNSNVKN